MKILAAAFCFALLSAQEPKTAAGTGVTDAVVDYYDSLADYFRSSRRAVTLINKKGIPDMEIPAVLLVARRSSASPNQVIDARKAGKAWPDIARENKVVLAGEDFPTEANIVFLSEYHGRAAEEIRAMRTKGASFVEINQEFRRSGSTPMKRKTAK